MRIHSLVLLAAALPLAACAGPTPSPGPTPTPTPVPGPPSTSFITDVINGIRQGCDVVADYGSIVELVASSPTVTSALAFANMVCAAIPRSARSSARRAGPQPIRVVVHGVVITGYRQ